MKKILAVIMLIMSLFMKPLFAPIEKISEKGKKIQAILEESKRKDKEFKKRKAEEDLALKVRQEEEVRKQQELQKKIDELKAQEEKAEQERVAAEKKAQGEQEVKRKMQAEDPRKHIADALGDLFAATKKYAAADAETDDKKKAEYIKSGDALFKQFGQELYDALSIFSFEEVEKIISTMELKPETHFMILQNLIEVYADHAKVIEAAHVKLFGDFIGALFDTIRIDKLQAFLMTEHGRKVLHDVQVRLLPIVEAPRPEAKVLSLGEALFVTMINFAAKLVEVLNKASTDQREALANVLLNWARVLPVTGDISEQALITILNTLKIEQLSKEAPFILHDWLLVFNKSKNIKFLTALKQQYLTAVYNNRTLPVLRSALQVLNQNLPYPELFKLQKTYLTLMTEPAIIAQIKDVDISLIVSTFKEIFEHNWADGEKLLADVISTLNKTIKTFGEIYEAASETNKSNIGEQLKKLQALKDQLDGMVLPKGLGKSIAGLFKWKNMFEPDIRKWNEKLRVRLLLNITDQNYKNGTFVSIEDFVKALRHLMENYHFYENNPEIQKLLLADAGKYFRNDFINMGIVPDYLDAGHKKRQDAFYAMLVFDFDLIKFLEKNFPNEFISIRQLLGIKALRKVIDDNDSRYLKNLDSFFDYRKNRKVTLLLTNPRTGQNRLVIPETGWIFIFLNIQPNVAYKIIDAMTDNQFKYLIESMHKIVSPREFVLYDNLFLPSLDKAENHQRALVLKNALKELKDYLINIHVHLFIDKLSNSALPLKSLIDDTIDQDSLIKMLGTMGKEMDNMSDSTFANIIRPVQEQRVDKADLGQRAAVLFSTIPYVKNAQRAKAILDTLMHVFYDPENANVQFDAYGLPITDAGLRKTLGEIEERLKAQQESEAKTKASAATSASTSSVSSGIASTTSTSSSSANVTTSSSTSSISSSMSALSRGIGALTQSRS